MVLAGGDIARQAEALLAIEDRRMMDDLVKRTGRYTTLRALADDFGIALGQRLIFVAHENNYPKEDKDPRDAFGPDPAVALIFPQQGPEKVRQLREYFLANKQQFGFPETYNYFLDPQKRYPLLEYYTPLMPGTGEIAVLQVGGDEKGEVVISNQAKLIKNVFQTWFDPGTSTSDRNYAEDPLYKDLLAEWLERKGNSYSHLFAFVNGPLALKALRNYVPTWAGEGSLFDPEKMRAERPAVFERILKSKYPDHTPQNVPAEGARRDRLACVDDEFQQRAATAKANISPKLAKEYEAKIEWLSSVPGLFLLHRPRPQERQALPQHRRRHPRQLNPFKGPRSQLCWVAGAHLQVPAFRFAKANIPLARPMWKPRFCSRVPCGPQFPLTN